MGAEPDRMQPLDLASGTAPLRLLCLGAHADDIEIGCGGTLLELLARRPGTQVTWVVFSTPGVREAEARAGAARFLERAERQELVLGKFRDGYFPYQGAEIKDFIEGLKQRVSPDVVFTHFRDDRHQDHRTISDLTWNTWRNHLVLEYEIPKYEGDLGQPNFFVQLDEITSRRKIEFLLECFPSQRKRHWFTADTFHGMMRLRGLESHSSSGMAEAFHCRKMVL